MNITELIPGLISSVYLLVNAVLSLYKYEIIWSPVCSTFTTRPMSGVIQLCDSKRTHVIAANTKHLLVRGWELAVARPFSSFARLFPLHQRVYIARRCGMRNSPRVTPADVINIKDNGALGHAPSNRTTHNTAAGTPCVMMGYPIKTQTTQHDELMCLSFCHDASGKLSFSTNQTSVRCLEDVLEVSKDVSSVHQVCGYLVQSKQ